MGPRRREVRLGALPVKRFLKSRCIGAGARAKFARAPRPSSALLHGGGDPPHGGGDEPFFGGGGAGGAHVAASTSCLASAPKSGKAPLFSLEYTSLPSTVTSKEEGRPVAPATSA